MWDKAYGEKWNLFAKRLSHKAPPQDSKGVYRYNLAQMKIIFAKG